MKQKSAVAPDYPAIALFSILLIMALMLEGVIILLFLLSGNLSGNILNQIYIIVGVVILMFLVEIAAAVWYGRSRYATGKKDGEEAARLATCTEIRQKPSWFAKHHRYDYHSESRL